jgi:cob(I)alamin adenosyltransferase
MDEEEKKDMDQGAEDVLVLPGDDGLPLETLSPDGDELVGGLETDDRQAAEIREIFGTAFPQYLQPVEEIVEQMLSGQGDDESASALGGMLTSLMEASSRMGFENIHELLERLSDRVSQIGSAADDAAARAIREDIINIMFDLKDLAEAMGGSGPTEQQQTIISALKNKPGIGQLVLRRLSAAGLVTVDQLKMGKPEEIAAVSGIDLEIVRNILEVIDDEHVELPGEVEALHDQVLDQLRKEVDAQAAVDELKADIRTARSKVAEHRAELQLIQQALKKKRAALKSYSRQTLDSAEILDELTSGRDILNRRLLRSEDAVQQKRQQLEKSRRERRQLEQQTANLCRAVGGLVDRLGRIRRTVAKGKPVQ